MKGNDLPWIEKYRPKSLSEVIGQPHITEKLSQMVAGIQNGDRNMPHLMFAGDAGVGKTSCAIAFVKDAFGDEWKSNWTELNASDERGIDTIRTKVKHFATSARLPHSKYGKVFNIIFLDEADSLTPEAQAALRRPMEKYVGTCRFILSMNHSTKIIPPIQNRCQVFRFHLLGLAEMKQAIIQIEKGEGIEMAPAAREYLCAAAEGSLRKALTTLYTVSLQPTKITEKDVRRVLDYVEHEKIEALLKMAAKGELDKVFKMVDDLYWRGYSTQDILYKTFNVIRKADWINKSSRAKILSRMAETEHYIIVGSNPLFQLKCFFAWLAEKNRKG